MLEASENLEFEQAIEYRELINSVKQIAQKQKISNSDGEDKDIIAMASDKEDAVVQVFFVREGRLIGRDHFYLRIAPEDRPAEILSSFEKQFYAGTPFVPKELLLPTEIADADIISAWLSARKGQKEKLV